MSEHAIGGLSYMLVKIMRVSSADDRQTVDLRRDALVTAGADQRHLHTDKASSARDNRAGLVACLDYLKTGDTPTDSVEARSAWTVAAAFTGDHYRPEGARYRVPVADRANRYDDAARRIAVLAIRRPGTV